MTIHVVGLGGSVRRSSTSLAALRVSLEGSRDAGAQTELLDLRELGLPWYDPQISAVPDAVRRLVERAASATAMIWSSPTYHGTISGLFKNAVDWLQLLGGHEPPYLHEKPIGLIATGAGVRTAQSLNTMALITQALRAWPVPRSVAINESHVACGPDGQISDPVVDAQLRAMGTQVTHVAGRLAAEPVGHRFAAP